MTLQEFIDSINSSTGPQNIDNPSANSLSSLFNTPSYQLLYGQPQSQANMNAVTAGTYDPTKSFRADPGYQFSINEGMKQLQQNAAAKGLLESGSLMKELQNYGQGMADQNYQRYLQQQAGLFSDYQNKLSGLSQFGASQTGAQQGLDVNNLLAQIAANGNLSTGQNLANSYLGTGSNIASLFGNQGVLNASAILNNAAAVANNLFQGNTFTSQLLSNLRASNAASANSSSAGNGASSGLGGLF